MKLLDPLLLVARRRRLADATIDAYSHWVKDFLTFSAARLGVWKHPVELATADVEAFLNDLVIRRRLSASSQNQALNALVFLYKHVLTAYGVGDFGIRRSGLRPEMRWMSRASI